jgi:hypothetical protein
MHGWYKRKPAKTVQTAIATMSHPPLFVILSTHLFLGLRHHIAHPSLLYHLFSITCILFILPFCISKDLFTLWSRFNGNCQEKVYLSKILNMLVNTKCKLNENSLSRNGNSFGNWPKRNVCVALGRFESQKNKIWGRKKIQEQF